MNGKPVRKPRNVRIDPEVLHRARVEALRSKKTFGEWLEVRNAVSSILDNTSLKDVAKRALDLIDKKNQVLNYAI